MRIFVAEEMKRNLSVVDQQKNFTFVLGYASFLSNCLRTRNLIAYIKWKLVLQNSDVLRILLYIIGYYIIIKDIIIYYRLLYYY